MSNLTEFGSLKASSSLSCLLNSSIRLFILISVSECFGPNISFLNFNDVKVGDIFVLCHAGGDTVNLISYIVSGFTPLLNVDEAVGGTEDHCKGTYLNRIFKKFLITKFGQNEK